MFGLSLDGLQIVNLEGVEISRLKFQDIELGFAENLVIVEGEGNVVKIFSEEPRLVKDCFEWYLHGKLIDSM